MTDSILGYSRATADLSIGTQLDIAELLNGISA
jgi:hypothetical protein